MVESISSTNRSSRPSSVPSSPAAAARIGYGVESDPGSWGGCRMAAGRAVPPLSLDDEAPAVASRRGKRPCAECWAVTSYATVVLPVPLEEAQRLVPPGSGSHESTGPDTTCVTLGGSTLDELATRLLALAVPLAVLAPDELRTTRSCWSTTARLCGDTNATHAVKAAPHRNRRRTLRRAPVHRNDPMHPARRIRGHRSPSTTRTWRPCPTRATSSSPRHADATVIHRRAVSGARPADRSRLVAGTPATSCLGGVVEWIFPHCPRST
jgi:hypothetical protein